MTRDEALDHVREGVERIIAELHCTQEHFEKEEWSQAALHCSQIAQYCTITGQVIMQYFMSMEESAEVVRQLIETNTGQPMEKVEIYPGAFIFQQQQVDVPDTLDGLDE